MTSNTLSGGRRITHLVRSRLPSGVTRASKKGALAFGLTTARFRMLPSVIIVGGQRCGTTTLFRLLSEHPQVRRPTVAKGTRYFEDNYHKGARWYRAHFPINRDNVITFESSGFYSIHPLAAERIARDLPGVRLVMMVRNPVERAFSAYKHEYARGYETETFERALALEQERIEGELERIRQAPTYSSYALRHNAYVTRGQYADQLDRLTEAVGAKNVYTLDADRFFMHSNTEFTLLNEWLGLDTWLPSKVQRWNARTSAPMPDPIREHLTEHFAPYDKALEKYLGRPPSWR